MLEGRTGSVMINLLQQSYIVVKGTVQLVHAEVRDVLSPPRSEDRLSRKLTD